MPDRQEILVFNVELESAYPFSLHSMSPKTFAGMSSWHLQAPLNILKAQGFVALQSSSTSLRYVRSRSEVRATDSLSLRQAAQWQELIRSERANAVTRNVPRTQDHGVVAALHGPNTKVHQPSQKVRNAKAGRSEVREVYGRLENLKDKVPSNALAIGNGHFGPTQVLELAEVPVSFNKGTLALVQSVQSAMAPQHLSAGAKLESAVLAWPKDNPGSTLLAGFFIKDPQMTDKGGLVFVELTKLSPAQRLPLAGVKAKQNGNELIAIRPVPVSAAVAMQPNGEFKISFTPNATVRSEAREMSVEEFTALVNSRQVVKYAPIDIHPKSGDVIANASFYSIGTDGRIFFYPEDSMPEANPDALIPSAIKSIVVRSEVRWDANTVKALPSVQSLMRQLTEDGFEPQVG